MRKKGGGAHSFSSIGHTSTPTPSFGHRWWRKRNKKKAKKQPTGICFKIRTAVILAACLNPFTITCVIRPVCSTENRKKKKTQKHKNKTQNYKSNEKLNFSFLDWNFYDLNFVFHLEYLSSIKCSERFIIIGLMSTVGHGDAYYSSGKNVNMLCVSFQWNINNWWPVQQPATAWIKRIKRGKKKTSRLTHQQ